MKTIIIQGRVKYGSVGYKVLNYARFRSRFNDGTFSADEYLSFCNGQYKLWDIQRAIRSLDQNGHVTSVWTGRFRYIESGVLGKLENAQKETKWMSNAGAFKKGHRGAHDNCGHISPASSDAENDLDLG